MNLRAVIFCLLLCNASSTCGHLYEKTVTCDDRNEMKLIFSSATHRVCDCVGAVIDADLGSC